MGTRRANLKNQDKPQKQCRCGNNTIYTGSYAHHNPKIDGIEVCEDCYVAYLIDRHMNRKAE